MLLFPNINNKYGKKNRIINLKIFKVPNDNVVSNNIVKGITFITIHHSFTNHYFKNLYFKIIF